MTREDIKNVTDIVHKTIYGFFDICGDNEEVPMTDKDKLLLEVNKAICSNIKALEQTDVLDEIIAKIENHCGLLKENHCKYCSTCYSVMGVREILEIFDKHRKSEEV